MQLLGMTNQTFFCFSIDRFSVSNSLTDADGVLLHETDERRGKTDECGHVLYFGNGIQYFDHEILPTVPIRISDLYPALFP